MVMHRALFTWFILLLFFILLCLQLEGRTHWNWFLIFLPMWVYNVIILIDALFHIVAACLHEQFIELIKNKNLIPLVIVLFLIAGEIMLCLKLEYKALGLTITHVLIPFWILLPLLIIRISATLFNGVY
ncbi:transmembrane protein 60 [Anthonomus grandis grandis]|uniref:transmembrane protein 60 n=1 Tax=Anthonomus grandis grandis TaxID=2921223 RepID=UPI002165E91C|nr:transmembrane protein 60 [Anthonomus grandis grandis]